MKDTNHMVLMVLVAVAIGAGGFFIGTRVSARRFSAVWGNNQPVMNRGGFGMMGRRGVDGDDRGVARGMMGGAGGEITKVNGNVVTLKYANGATQDVTLSDSAVVETLVKGTAKDLKAGQTIMVTGGGFWNNTQTVIVRPQ